MDKTSLGDRMKQYEAVSKNYLCRRAPVIIRLDGKAFHTFTRGFDKPFDDVIEQAMKKTMIELCMNIQGCVLGYTQSDEISLVLCDYQKIDTDAWFEYNVQKVVSVAASDATFYFNQALSTICNNLWRTNDTSFADKIELIGEKLEKGARFDARCFNLPKDEVVNYLIWRQQDATRNSIQGLAQSMFSHKELQGLNCSQLLDKLWENGSNWNDLTTYQKRGTCCVKLNGTREAVNKKTGEAVKIPIKCWGIESDIPIFAQNRAYIEDRITFDKE
jgi:tRNA(His) 5'-end guanylyltransferase